MVKLSIFLVRRPDLSREEFTDHWTKVHLPLLQAAPFYHLVCRHVFQLAIRDQAASPYDGVAEAWFETAEDMAAAAGSDYLKSVLAKDEEAFLDRSKTTMMVSSEFVLK